MSDLRETAERFNRIGNFSIKPGNHLHKLETDLRNRRQPPESPQSPKPVSIDMTIFSNVTRSEVDRR